MPKAFDAGARVVRADRKTAQAVLPYEGSLPIRMLGHVADLGDQPPLRFLCASLIAIGLVRGNRRLAGAGARMFAAHMLATWTKDFIKHRVDRTRPNAADEPGKDSKPRPGRDRSKEETSFPSGHSAGVAAVARAYARDYPEHGVAAQAAAGLLALAQIPRCAHYPTDVGAGIAIGVAAEWAVELARRAALD
jgi:membrane-associated phospholipid phosphatase